MVVADLCRAISATDPGDGDAHCHAYGLRSSRARIDGSGDAGLLSAGRAVSFAGSARRRAPRIFSATTGGAVKAPIHALSIQVPALQRLANGLRPFPDGGVEVWYDRSWGHR